jgi:hypothetical protein
VELATELLAMFFRADPVGINFETNTDEYEPEVRTVLPRLPHASSAVDVQRILHEEFSAWFGSSAGPAERYESLAQDVWQLWSRTQAIQSD